MQLSLKTNNWKVFGQLFKIQLIAWFKDPNNLFLGFFISLYMVLCWLAFRQGNPFLMISGILAGIVRNSLQLYTRTMSNWRSQGLFERTNQIPVPNWIKYSSLLSFNLFMTSAIALIMFGTTIAIFPTQIEKLHQANQLMVWTALILCWLTSVSLAHFLTIVIKNNRWCMTISAFTYFTTMYFLGLGFPFNAIISVDWLNYLLYLHPFRYVMNIGQAGFVNAPDFFYDGGVFANKTSYVIDFGYGRSTWLAYLLAVIVISFFVIFCLSATKLKNKHLKRNKIGRLIYDPSSSQYIKSLKQVQSLDGVRSLHKERKEYWKENKLTIKKQKKSRS